MRRVGHTITPSATLLAQGYADRAVSGDLEFRAGQYAFAGDDGYGRVQRIPREDVEQEIIRLTRMPMPPVLITAKAGAAVTSDSNSLFLAEFYLHG